MKLLIDECLCVDLVQVGTKAGFETYHVAHKGMNGWSDHKIARLIFDEDYTFVTNNAKDFRKLHGKTEIHAGLIIIVPQLGISKQTEIFKEVLAYIHKKSLINRVVEASIENNEIVLQEYPLPSL